MNGWEFTRIVSFDEVNVTIKNELVMYYPPAEIFQINYLVGTIQIHLKVMYDYIHEAFHN